MKRWLYVRVYVCFCLISQGFDRFGKWGSVATFGACEKCSSAWRMELAPCEFWKHFRRRVRELFQEIIFQKISSPLREMSSKLTKSSHGRKFDSPCAQTIFTFFVKFFLRTFNLFLLSAYAGSHLTITCQLVPLPYSSPYVQQVIAVTYSLSNLFFIIWLFC